MSGYLLDTHILLWLDSDPSRVPARIHEVLQQPETLIFVSAASIWEIAIKIALGKLALGTSLAELLERHRFTELPVTARHAAAVAELPHHHGDPFDRLLIAQAYLESFVLVTADRRMSAYNVPMVLAE